MAKLFYIPLENAPQRYTAMMNQAVAALVDETINVAEPTNTTNGAPATFSSKFFLDPTSTIIFKSRQVEVIVRMIRAGMIKSGDGLLFGDLFFPGLEGIAYTAELLGVRLFFFGWNYAGRADLTDLTRSLNPWADDAEAAWHKIADHVFVGSEFHQKNVMSYFRLPGEKVSVTGYPLDLSWIENVSEIEPYNSALVKLPRVIWPHRICAEKGFDTMLQIAERLDPRLHILITSSGDPVDLPSPPPGNVKIKFNLSKQEYYQHLATSEFYLSTAHQETFGYTLQEAIFFRCKVLAPNRACYPEMLPYQNLYTTYKDAADRLNAGNVPTVNRLLVERWNGNAETAVRICRAVLAQSLS